MPEDSSILKEDVNVGGNEVCQLQLKQRKRMQKTLQFLCCRAEGGITIEPANLEDPAIFDELVDSGLLNLDGCLTNRAGTGSKNLPKTSDSLCPLTVDNVEGIKEVTEEVPAEEAPAEEAAVAPEVNVEGAAVTVKHGKVVISIKEGKDIYLELPVSVLKRDVRKLSYRITYGSFFVSRFPHVACKEKLCYY